MAFTNETTHYGLPQWIGSDKPTYLVDQNDAYQKIDSEIYNANVAAGEAVTTANGAASTAAGAASTAAGAVETAQAAQTTATAADGKADTAITQSQAAQTAAGAAQTAAAAAQEAAAGNSITNLAPAYDPTITYAVDDLVTAEGKLYKCIVAVSSPEQFDINKWDDVTTSEVYARIGAGGDVYTKAEADAKFETQTHASSTFETIANVTSKNNLQLSTDATKQIRFGIDGNGNYGYIKNGENTVNPFRSATGSVTASSLTVSSGTVNLNATHTLQVVTIGAHSSNPSTAESYCSASNANGCALSLLATHSGANASKTYKVEITGASPSFTISTAPSDAQSIIAAYLD